MEKAFEIELREGVEVVRNAYKEPPGEWDIESSTVLAIFEGPGMFWGWDGSGEVPELGPYTLEGELLEGKRQALRGRGEHFALPEVLKEYGGAELLRALVEALLRAHFDLRKGEVELHLKEGWSSPFEVEAVEGLLSKIALAPASFVWRVLGAKLKGSPEPGVVRLPEHIMRAGHITQAETSPTLFDLNTEGEVNFRSQALERLRQRGEPGADVARVAWNPTAGEEIVHSALLEVFAHRSYPAAVKLTSEELLKACGWEYTEHTLRDLGQALALLSTRPALFAFGFRPQAGTNERKAGPWRKKETVGPLWNVTREAAKSTNRTLSWTIAPGLTSLEPEERFSIFFQVNPELGGDPAFYRAEPAGLLQRGNGGGAQVTADAIRLRKIFGTSVTRGKVKAGTLLEVVVNVEELRKELQRGETVPKFEGLTERERHIVAYFLEAQRAGKSARAAAEEVEGLELKELRRTLRRANVQEKLPRVPSVRAVKERLARALGVLRMEGEPYRVTGYKFVRGKKGLELRAVLEVR